VLLERVSNPANVPIIATLPFPGRDVVSAHLSTAGTRSHGARAGGGAPRSAVHRSTGGTGTPKAERGLRVRAKAASILDIFDAANLRAPQSAVKVGASPMGIAFSADGKTALVANHGDGTVSVIDIATAKVTRAFCGRHGD
jgi:hypothetical protein